MGWLRCSFVAIWAFFGCASASTLKSVNGIYIDANNDSNYDASFTSVGLGLGTASPSSKLHLLGNACISGKVGIGTPTPKSQLHIGGTFGLSAQTISSNTELSGNSLIIANMSAASGNLKIVLPSASLYPGRVYNIKKSSSDNILRVIGEIDSFSAIKLVTSSSSAPYLNLVSDNNQWYILSSSDNIIGCETGSSNLVSHWTLDEDQIGSEVSDQTGANPMTYNGSMDNNDVINGKVDNGLDLDGSNDYLRDSSPTVPDAGEPITLAAWVTTDATNSFRNFICLNNATFGGGASRGVQLLIKSTTFQAVKSGGTTLVNSGITPTLGVWYHVVFTWDGTTNRIYVNGDEKANSTVTHQSGSISNIWISTYNGVAEDWDGKVDDIRIYNRALSAHEAKSMYECTTD